MSKNLSDPITNLKRWSEAKGDNIFLRQPLEDGTLRITTWSQAYTQVAAMADYLSGFPRGSRIGIFSNNCDHWILADLAIMAAGMISVPIYPTAGLTTIREIVEHAEIKLVFVGKLSQPENDQIFSQDIEQVAIYQPANNLRWWSDIVTQSTSSGHDVLIPQLNEIASIIYTSGTTGKPKGVVVSYRAIANAFDYIDQTFNFSPNERFFSYLPLAHVAERMAVEMGALFYGCSIRFIGNLETFARDIINTKPTIFFGVPRIWIKLKQKVEAKFGGSESCRKLTSLPVVGRWLKRLIVRQLGLSDAWLCLTGAASIPVEVIDWYRQLGIEIYEVYGMSETLGVSNANRPGFQKVGSVGKALKGCEVLVAKNGEVMLRGGSLMDGYYLEPELTASVIQDGWLRTGDLGALDEQGFLTIKGRVKELFKTSKGKYVSPTMIENKLAAQLGVDQVCVMGAGLTQPVAVVVIDKSSEPLPTEQITQFEKALEQINLELEKHEKIAVLGISYTQWDTNNGLMTPTLKIRRQPLEDRYAQTLSSYSDKPVRCVLLDI